MKAQFIARHHGNSRILALAMLMGLMSSCKENTVGPTPTPAPTPLSRGPSSLELSTLPLQIGNQWAYFDTNVAGVQSAIQVANVVGVAYDNGVYRYELQTAAPPWSQLWQFLYLYCRKDSIFVDNPNSSWGGEVAYLPFFSGSDTVRLYDREFTRVYPLGYPLVTSIGVFDSVFVYDGGVGNVRLRRYFKPGLGVLEADLELNSKLLEQIRLIHVSLNHFPPDATLPPAN